MFIAIGPNAWGRGETLDTALRECKRQTSQVGQKLKKGQQFDVFETDDPRPYIDSMGRIWAENPVTRVYGKGDFFSLHTEEMADAR